MATFESAIKLEPTNVQTSFSAPYQDETAITIDKEDLASVSVLQLVSVKLRSHIQLPLWFYLMEGGGY